MITHGKFLIFSDRHDFAAWLKLVVVNREIKLVQNHHTYLPGYKEWYKKSDPGYWLDSMERFHMQNGYSEIAQNLTTFPDGSIAVCRPLSTIPAGIKGANSHGVCIEHLGNFDKGGDEMTEEHQLTITTLNAELLHKFGLPINTDTVVYHHWYDLITGNRTNGEGLDVTGKPTQVKTCPGMNFFGGNTVRDCAQNFIPFIKLVTP